MLRGLFLPQHLEAGRLGVRAELLRQRRQRHGPAVHDVLDASALGLVDRIAQSGTRRRTQTCDRV